jgi:hypothetical protein
MTVDPQGNVTEVRILKRMGVFGYWRADVTALKTLIRWRASPGPVRIVDVPWSIPPGATSLLLTRGLISQAVNDLIS